MHDVDPLINSLYQAFDLLGVVLNGIIGGTIAPAANSISWALFSSPSFLGWPVA